VFPGKSPAPSNSPLLRSVHAGKIRQLVKRLPLHRAQHSRHQLRRSRHFSSVIAIDASLAAAFRLPTTNVGDESICKATIRSKIDEAIKLEVVLKIEPNVRIRTPIRALSESVIKKFKELPLPDERFHRPATISLILGADDNPKVMQPGLHMVDEGLPVAQKTVFG